MSNWAYRMTRHLEDEEYVYDIRELYYDDDGTVTGWSELPASPNGENWWELAEDVTKMGTVIAYDIFDLDTGKVVSRQECRHNFGLSPHKQRLNKTAADVVGDMKTSSEADARRQA